jgi:hypothetical protein
LLTGLSYRDCLSRPEPGKEWLLEETQICKADIRADQAWVSIFVIRLTSSLVDGIKGWRAPMENQKANAFCRQFRQFTGEKSLH